MNPKFILSKSLIVICLLFALPLHGALCVKKLHELDKNGVPGWVHAWRDQASAAVLKKAVGAISHHLQLAAVQFKAKNTRAMHDLLLNDKIFEGTQIEIAPPQERVQMILTMSDLAKNPESVIVEHPDDLKATTGASLYGEKLIQLTISPRDTLVELGPVTYSIWDPRFDGDARMETFRQRENLLFFEEVAHALQHAAQATEGSQYLRIHGKELAAVRKFDPILNAAAKYSGMEVIPDWSREADVYAYMLDVLGPENVPLYVGTESGYPVRAIIDANRGRRWTQAQWEKYMGKALPRP